MSGGSVDRRAFLLGGAGGGAWLAGFGEAGAASLGEAAGERVAGEAIVLRDPRLALPEDVSARLATNGARVITLGGDPVRFWRSAEAASLRLASTRLYGLTRWADFLIFRGLAVETRRHVRYERLHRDSDAFTWLIA